MTDTASLTHAVLALRDHIDTVDRLTLDVLDATDDAMTAASTLAVVRRERMRLAKVEAALEREAGRRIKGRDPLVGDGWTAVRRGGSVTDEWYHDDVASALVRNVSEKGGGPFAVRDALLNCAHIDYWRVGQLKTHGVDPDEYRSKVAGRVTVQVTYSDGVP